MSAIRCVYSEEPKFPATDQHPDAARYQVGGKWVDALGGQPTQAELDTFLGVDAASLAEVQRRASVDAAIAADTTIAQLKAMTPTDFDTWWAANVTTAAQAITVLKRIARVVLRRVL